MSIDMHCPFLNNNLNRKNSCGVILAEASRPPLSLQGSGRGPAEAGSAHSGGGLRE